MVEAGVVRCSVLTAARVRAQDRFAKRVSSIESIAGTHRSMLPNLEGEVLRSFVTVAECNGFTAAARRLNKTQSAVSLQIKRLEAMLGVRLFQRTSRRLVLTGEGAAFLIHARRILRQHEEAVAAVNPALAEPVIRVGMPDDYAELFLPRVLHDFETRYPRVRPDIHCDMSWELLRRLDAGDLDLVLAIRHAARSAGRTLCHEDIVWVAADDFANAAMGPVPLVLYPDNCPYRARGIEALSRIGRDWRVVYTSQSPTGIRIAVQARGAVTITSRRTVPANWRILGEDDGFPALPPAELQLHSAPSASYLAAGDFADLLEAALADADAGNGAQP
jgi:DNA-binding transcriptional LysR family regulator